MRWTLLCVLLVCSACQGRKVVSSRAFQYAELPDEVIARELPPDEAAKVLVELERIQPPTQADLDRMSSVDGSRSVTRENGQLLINGVPVRAAPDQPDKLYESGTYFSTMTAIAVEEGLDPTAIPALIVGYRPAWDLIGLQGTGIGFDLVVGGAVSPGGSGDSDIELALGLGVSLPWSNSGALSFGVVSWRTEDESSGSSDTETALYFGISLGSFNVKAR